MRRDPGSTSNSFTVEIVDDSGLPVPSLVAATFPAVSYQRLNAAAVSVTLSDLAAIGSTFSAGGVFEIGNGRYRLDIDDAAFATATNQLSIVGEASGKRLICPPIEVRYESANAVQIGGTNQTGLDLGATWTGTLATNLGTLAGHDPGGVLAKAGDAMTLSGDFTTTMKTSLNAATPAVTVSDKTGFKLASDGLDSVTIETGLNARQALSVIASASSGVLAGAEGTSVTIAAAGVPATNRITATVDTNGNRSAVTLNPPA